jgi:hypothetical protein
MGGGHGRSWSSMADHAVAHRRGERGGRGGGERGAAGGAAWGVAPWGGAKELDHAAPFSLCVEMLHHEEEKKKREKRKRRKERERRRGRKKKRKNAYIFSNLETFGGNKIQFMGLG